jgi:hypothetical protein
MRYVLCNDGTRIYFEHVTPLRVSAACEQHGQLGAGDESTMGQQVTSHANGAHQGKHSVT